MPSSPTSICSKRRFAVRNQGLGSRKGGRVGEPQREREREREGENFCECVVLIASNVTTKRRCLNLQFFRFFSFHLVLFFFSYSPPACSPPGLLSAQCSVLSAQCSVLSAQCSWMSRNHARGTKDRRATSLSSQNRASERLLPAIVPTPSFPTSSACKPSSTALFPWPAPGTNALTPASIAVIFAMTAEHTGMSILCRLPVAISSPRWQSHIVFRPSARSSWPGEIMPWGGSTPDSQQQKVRKR